MSGCFPPILLPRLLAAGNTDFPINPYEILGLNPTSSSHAHVKSAFVNKLVQSSLDARSRELISLANYTLTSTTKSGVYKGVPPWLETAHQVHIYHTPFTIAAYGKTKKLQFLISNNKSLIENADEHGRTLLYLACKSGFLDMVEMLLENGADTDKVQRDGSTSLHAAVFFGHNLVVDTLLQYGAPSDIKNTWGHTALQESASTEITTMFQNTALDLISSLAVNLKKKRLVSRVRFIRHHGLVIAKEFIREPSVCDQELPQIIKEWKLSWHGTRYKNLESILREGLLPSGTKGVKPTPGHFPLGQKFMDIDNWAGAIFISPSIWYSSNPAYAEKVTSRREEWCVLLKTYCKPESYGRYDPTVFNQSDFFCY